MIPARNTLFAFALGGFAVLGYAPFYFYPATLLALAGLFTLWYKATDARSTGLLGLAFGMGLFGGGIYWIYISLHDFGGMPGPAAFISTALLCTSLAIFPALAGFLTGRFPVSFRLWLAPVLWVLMEWLRGWIFFTGFPWLTVGYTQVPFSPLANLAPVVGIYGVSLAGAASAGFIASRFCGLISRKRLFLGIAAIWFGTSMLGLIEWSQPVGKPVSFSLLQGNIAQDLKWREDELLHTLNLYEQMVAGSPAQIVVLPEMAFPMLMQNLPAGYLNRLAADARRKGRDTLIGVPEAGLKDGTTVYYNSMISLGQAPGQTYRKSHLVPFGEFIPLKSWIGWIYRDLLHIPLADLQAGTIVQPPMQLAGQRIAFNICYEDIFGEEIIRALPEATLLINVSNDAWFGRSLAAHQHLQMSQARAMETARTVLRSTNTGATAMIGPDGRVLKQLPHFTTASLDGLAQGYTGTTPYVRWGNLPIVLIMLACVAYAGWRKRKIEAGR